MIEYNQFNLTFEKSLNAIFSRVTHVLYAHLYVLFFISWYFSSYKKLLIKKFRFFYILIYRCTLINYNVSLGITTNTSYGLTVPYEIPKINNEAKHTRKSEKRLYHLKRPLSSDDPEDYRYRRRDLLYLNLLKSCDSFAQVAKEENIKIGLSEIRKKRRKRLCRERKKVLCRR